MSNSWTYDELSREELVDRLNKCRDFSDKLDDMIHELWASESAEETIKAALAIIAEKEERMQRVAELACHS